MTGIGFGGKFKFYNLTCQDINIFFHTKNNEEITISTENIQLLPIKNLKLLPESVLGRDILNYFEINYNFKKTHLELIGSM